jgi:hypothetical protein
MNEELVFSVDGATAQPASEISLSDAGLRERQHLQEWVAAHPEILGSGALVVTMEFDRWLAAEGNSPQDRLDILALDNSGRLVVAELKRGKAPETVQMQALNYAAMASRFTLDLLASAHAKYVRARTGEDISASDALARLQDHAPEISDESLRTPRVTILASQFPASVTATAVFLHENGIDISLRRFQAYRTQSSEIVLTVSQLWPIPDAEDFTISPRSSSHSERQVAKQRTRRAKFLHRLIEAGVPAQGEELAIVVPSGLRWDASPVEEWLEEDPRRATVRWTRDASAVVEWELDGKGYRLLDLLRYIVEEATGTPPPGIWAAIWFELEDGRTLAQVNNSLDLPEDPTASTLVGEGSVSQSEASPGAPPPGVR